MIHFCSGTNFPAKNKANITKKRGKSVNCIWSCIRGGVHEITTVTCRKRKSVKKTDRLRIREVLHKIVKFVTLSLSLSFCLSLSLSLSLYYYYYNYYYYSSLTTAFNIFMFLFSFCFRLNSLSLKLKLKLHAYLHTTYIHTQQ